MGNMASAASSTAKEVDVLPATEEDGSQRVSSMPQPAAVADLDLVMQNLSGRAYQDYQQRRLLLVVGASGAWKLSCPKPTVFWMPRLGETVFSIRN